MKVGVHSSCGEWPRCSRRPDPWCSEGPGHPFWLGDGRAGEPSLPFSAPSWLQNSGRLKCYSGGLGAGAPVQPVGLPVPPLSAHLSALLSVVQISTRYTRSPPGGLSPGRPRPKNPLTIYQNILRWGTMLFSHCANGVSGFTDSPAPPRVRPKAAL